MRLGHFLEQSGLASSLIDRLSGYLISVDLPADWESADAIPGMQLWIWPRDPNVESFCANAVLTLHHIAVPLEPPQVFEMLCEQQIESVPGCEERLRHLRPNREGGGFEGWLVLQFAHELGPIDSVSVAHMVADDQQVRIVQLTVTALRESPVDWASIRLSVMAENPTAALARPVGLNIANEEMLPNDE